MRESIAKNVIHIKKRIKNKHEQHLVPVLNANDMLNI